MQRRATNKTAWITLIAAGVMLALEARHISRGEGSWVWVALALVAIVLAAAQLGGLFANGDAEQRRKGA